MIMNLAKTLLHVLFEDYRINVVVASEGETAPLPWPDGVIVRPMVAADMDVIGNSQSEKVRVAFGYAEAGQIGYVLSDANGIQCVAHFATMEQYDYASTWPLSKGKLCLVNIATEERAFGKGYAPLLISAATTDLVAQGAERIKAFIWWSNTASRRAFAKAGWRMIGRSVEVKIFGRWFAMRWKSRQY